MDISSTTRLEALETKVSYLEQTLQQISDELYRQQQQLERVVARNQQLLDELGSAQGGSASEVEIPPHY